jgi:hypothetical protein
MIRVAVTDRHGVERADVFIRRRSAVSRTLTWSEETGTKSPTETTKFAILGQRSGRLGSCCR